MSKSTAMTSDSLSSDPSLTSYLEGFDAALDSAAITCARCASLESRIAELVDALKPFARFACDEALPECACFNCKARAVIQKETQP